MYIYFLLEFNQPPRGDPQFRTQPVGTEVPAIGTAIVCRRYGDRSKPMGFTIFRVKKMKTNIHSPAMT